MGTLSANHKQLAERHLRELREASAITDDVIAERGYRTVSDPAELLELGFADYQARTPALLVPLHRVDGSNGQYALKPDHPRLERRPDKPDRPIKYEYPAGSSHVLDVPPRFLQHLTDPGVPIMFVEGGKKADSVASLGYCAVNIWGTSAWYRNPQHGGFATIEPLEDWRLLLPTLDGRVCYLAYDSDAWRNAAVAHELRRLANWLVRQGALVFIVHLPDEPDGAKNGADDLIARHGPAAFHALVDEAEPWGSQGMVRKLHAELAELRALQSAQRGVLRNTDLTPAQKLVTLATINEAGWRASAGHPTPYRVHVDNLAAAAGCSDSTVSHALTVLSAADGIFAKQVTREYTPEHGWMSALFLTPRGSSDLLALLRAAAVYAPTKPPAPHRYPHCPQHPQADIHQRAISVCVECGQVTREREQILNCKICISETEAVPGPSLRLTSDVFCNSAPCRACGRSWIVHGAADVFGICAERGPPDVK